MDPTCFGWCKDHKNKSLIAITVPSSIPLAPPEILQMIRCGDRTCSTGRCRYASARLACTVFCDGYKLEDCQNKWTKSVAEQSDDNEHEDEDKIEDWDEN